MKTGFTVDTVGTSTSIDCGLQLQNTSASDAHGVTATVNFNDTAGRAVTSDQVTMSIIPAGATFYANCGAGSNVTFTPSSMQVTVKVDRSTRKSAQLPPVTALALSGPDEFSDTKTLTGNLANPYAQPLPDSAIIYAVYFDSNGNIVGGDLTFTGVSIEPGATVGFSFPFVPGNVVAAQVSVDPCGIESALPFCIGS